MVLGRGGVEQAVTVGGKQRLRGGAPTNSPRLACPRPIRRLDDSQRVSTAQRRSSYGTGQDSRARAARRRSVAPIRPARSHRALEHDLVLTRTLLQVSQHVLTSTSHRIARVPVPLHLDSGTLSSYPFFHSLLILQHLHPSISRPRTALHRPTVGQAVEPRSFLVHGQLDLPESDSTSLHPPRSLAPSSSHVAQERRRWTPNPA